jgi:hypothetical protein
MSKVSILMIFASLFVVSVHGNFDAGNLRERSVLLFDELVIFDQYLFRDSNRTKRQRLKNLSTVLIDRPGDLTSSRSGNLQSLIASPYPS